MQTPDFEALLGSNPLIDPKLVAAYLEAVKDAPAPSYSLENPLGDAVPKLHSNPAPRVLNIAIPEDHF